MTATNVTASKPLPVFHTEANLDATPGAPLARAPIAVFDHQYHPDTPGPIHNLIWALHARLVALETELGWREAPPVVAPTPVVAPVAVPTTTEVAVTPPVTPTTPATSGTLSGS